MNGKAIGLVRAALAAIGALASACGSDGDADASQVPPGGDRALNAAPQAQTNGQLPGITVSGEGVASLQPDTAVVSLGVSVVKGTAREARDSAAQSMAALLESVKSNGVDEKDIQTTQFSLNPEYSYGGSVPVLTGYRVTNTVSVKVREIDRVADVLDKAVEAVGDPLQISGVSFTVDDTDAVLSDARAAAMNQAKAKAQQLAELGGVTLGAPVSIIETSGNVQLPPYYFAGANEAADYQKTSIQPGELEITVSVQVTYAVQ